jgi:glycosyltransferase involved in cell wall biosynthesis
MLSVVTVNLNNSNGLSRTLDSLKTQGDRNFQWVFMDGLSKDNSVTIANQFKRDLDVVVSESDTGIYNAMNKAIGSSAGDYILFLNSGDVFASGDAIEHISKNLEGDVDLLTFGFEVRGKARMPKPKWWRFWSLPTSHQAIVYKRSLLIDFPFDEKYRFASDFDQFLRINAKPRNVKKINSILVINEQYGCDDNLEKVLSEYKEALIGNNLPKFWAWFVYAFKMKYLKAVLQ